MPEFLSKPVPHEEAAKFIANKPVVSRQVFDGLLPDLRARAFVITGVENANVVQTVRDLVAELPQGADWDKVKADIAGRISPWLDQGEGNQGQGEKRAELLLRAHGYQAYQAAQYEVLDRQRAAFPYWGYQTAGDDHVRDTHAALDGLVLPADSPFWETHFPPWDFGCRCYIAPMSADDVAEIERADAAKKPEERRVLDGDRLRQLEQIGELRRAMPGDNGLPRQYDMRAPEQRGGTYRFDPGSLKMGADQLRERYDAETWKTFEGWAKKQPLDFGPVAGRTVWEWMNAQPARATRAPARNVPRAQRVEPTAPAAAAAIPPPSAGAYDAAAVEAEREAIRTAAYRTEQKISNSNVNTTLKLINGRTVIFKPGAREYVSESGRDLRPGIKPGTQYPREVAASLLDQELRIGLVPPTTVVTWKGEVGSAQLWKDGFRPAWAFGNDMLRLIGRLPARVQQDWRLLDDLMGHLDRHGKNFMLRVIGARRAERVELALIDNGLSFAPEPANPRAYMNWAPLEGKAIDATNLARLRDLISRETEVRARLGQYLPAEALDRMFARARLLLTNKTYGYPD